MNAHQWFTWLLATLPVWAAAAPVLRQWHARQRRDARRKPA